MSSSSKRIVLVDPRGDVLFSGESMIAGGAKALREGAVTDDATDESCPETMRSAGSGVYRAAERHVSVEDADVEGHADAEPPTRRRSVRAA